LGLLRFIIFSHHEGHSVLLHGNINQPWLRLAEE
jgi:hypothetical protein